MIAILLLGIIVPAALLVAAVRRWIAPVPWRTALLFLLLTLGFLHGAVLTTKLPVPVDEAVRGYPWHGVVGNVDARNPLTNDTVKLFLPWMQVAREELAHGRAPLWNRYSFAGYPLLANGESAPFSPLFLATLFVPLPQQIVAMAALKIFAALLFTWLFLKREQASDAAATFGAVVFAFSTVMTVFLYYSTASVVAFLPAAAFALLHAMERQTKAGIVLVAITIARAASVRNVRNTAPAEFAMTVVSSASEPLRPGRRLYVNGHRVSLHHIDDVFIGFDVPAGVSDVRVVYRPVSFYVSCVIALLAIIGMVILKGNRGCDSSRGAAIST